MSRLRRDETSVSLFPFLAVLICTMGALIVLLVVMVQRVGNPGDSAYSAPPAVSQITEVAPPSAEVDSQITPAPAKPLEEPAGPLLESLDQRLADAQWQAEMLKESREETLRRLREHQMTLSRIEDRTRVLVERREALQEEARQIAEAADNKQTESDRIEAQLARLRTTIRDTEKALEEAQIEASDKRQLYAIIPYDGPLGTKRRPIYVECLGDRVIVQPEGIELFAADLAAELGPDNALAALLRATREYLLDNQVSERSAEAYPLLVVRPNGAEAYAACRRALQGWDDEFGYELVPQEMELKYPEPDPALALHLQGIVERTRHLARLMASKQPRAAAGLLLSADSTTGGFVTQRGEIAGTYAQGRPGTEGGSGVVGAADRGITGRHPTGGGTGNGVGPFGGLSSGGVPNDATPSAITHNHVNGLPAGGGVGGHTPGLVPPASTQIGDSSASPNTLPHFGQLPRNGVPGNGGPGDGGPGNGGPGNGGSYAAGAQPPGTNHSPHGSTGSGSAGGQLAYGPTSGGGVAGVASPDGNGGQAGGVAGGVAGGTAAGAGGSMAGAIGGSSDMGAGSTWGGADDSGSLASMDGSPSATSGSLVSMSQSSSTSNASRIFGDQDNWGLPNAVPHAIGITRPVQLRCAADQLILFPYSRRPAAIAFDGRTENAIQPFIASLWKHIESWGIAGNGVYWKPILHVEVVPGGEARFEEFAALLENSGLEMIRR